MADIFSAVVGFFGVSTQFNEFVVNPLKNQFRYLFRYNDFIQQLRVEVGRLNEDRESLQRRIEAAERNLEVSRRSVKDWIRRVDEVTPEANRILVAEQEVQNGTCLSGTCPNLKSRYSLGKQAKKMTEDVKQLLEECGKFERVSDPAPPTGTETIPPTSGTLEFESRKRKEEEIMECLRDDKILMIGICGMGGVGKTTMVDKIGIKAREEKLFDEIVKAVVSQQVDILNTQKQIAKHLGLALENEENVSVCANRLHERLLLSPKKVLLYFDDVWEWLDLGKIGIPPQCKMISTSRDQHVFEQMMTKEDARKILKLDSLNEDESWELFREKAGSIVDEPHLRQSAVEVAKECKGLPLALATVGRAMSGKIERATWDDALHELRVAAPENIQGYIKEVYQPLKLSYDALERKEAKDFFLLCCLFPEDSNFSIEDLVYYGVALQIFSHTATIRQARNRAHSLVEKLKKCFLLMDADDSDHTRVKMHDVVRDMAVSIASGDEHGFMASHYTEAWPENVFPENCTCIYLIFLRREAVLPKTLKYPRLEALHLQFPYRIERLPESFFDGMTGLRFLCIRYAKPPPTLRMLTQLRVLILSYCESKMIYEIGELVNLEILHLPDSKIEMLPKEIGALTKLKLLDLNDSSILKKIAPGVVSNLSQLEELGLGGCPIEWEVEERGSERSNASLAEVSSLRNLSLLDIQIGGKQALSKFGMEKFYRDILIGNHRCLRTLKIESLQGLRILFSPEVLRGLINLTTFEVFDCPMLEEIIEMEENDEQRGRNMIEKTIIPRLRSLKLSGLPKIRYFCTCSNALELPLLEWLTIQECPMMMTFAMESLDGNMSNSSPRSFLSKQVICPNLKGLYLRQLRNGSLRTLFSPEFFKSLINLTQLEVFDCPMLEKFIELEENEEQRGRNMIEKTIIPRLEILKLSRLPKIWYFCTFSNALELPSLQFLTNEECPMMMTFALESCNTSMPNSIPRVFFSKQVICPNLKGLYLRQLRNGSLRTLFSPEFFRSLINLTQLEIFDCPMLEEIIELQENEEQRGRNMIEKTIIPRLKSLQLSGLPKIRYFCTFRNALELSSLKRLTIEECPMMMTFAMELLDGSMSNSSPRSFLSKQVICLNLEWLDLKQLRIGSLRTLFSPEVFRGLINLKGLEVFDCPMLQEIIELEKNEEQSGRNMIKKTISPRLNYLKLSRLPKIRYFCTFSNVLELPSLEWLTIQECPMMMTFALELGNVSMLNSIPRTFFSKQVICLNLKRLNVTSCPSLKSLFSSGIRGGLTNLQGLGITDCSMLEEVIAEEGENVHIGEVQETKVVWNLPKLECLALSGLPMMHGFFNIHSDLELPLLSMITIRGCPEVKNSLSLGLRCLSKGVKIHGITDPKDASHFFFNKELTENESSLNRGRFKFFQSDLSFDRSQFTRELYLVKGLSNDFFFDGWKDAHGEIEIEKLSLGITYEIVFVIMMVKEKDQHKYSGLKLIINVASDVREEDMRDKLTEEWIEILGGEFTPTSGQHGQLRFSVAKNNERKDGVLLKGVYIRPKEIVE